MFQVSHSHRIGIPSGILLLALTLVLTSLPTTADAQTRRKKARKAAAAVAAATAVTAVAASTTTASASTTPSVTAEKAPPTPVPTAAPNSPPPPSSLWISSMTSETLYQSIRKEAWDGALFPSEAYIYQLRRVEQETAFGVVGMVQTVEGSERGLTASDARKIGTLLSDPGTFSRVLTAEDSCTTNSPSLGLRLRGDSGMIRLEITPECNEMVVYGFNAGDEPVGELRLGYGPGRAQLLEALRQPAKGLVPEEMLR